MQNTVTGKWHGCHFKNREQHKIKFRPKTLGFLTQHFEGAKGCRPPLNKHVKQIEQKMDAGHYLLGNKDVKSSPSY